MRYFSTTFGVAERAGGAGMTDLMMGAVEEVQVNRMVGRMGRRGKYSTKEGEEITMRERRIIPIPGGRNNREDYGIYDIGENYRGSFNVKMCFS